MKSADPRGGTRRPALTYATGASRNQFGPIFIPAHVVRKYSASKIIAAVHFHMRTAFGFALPRNHSVKSRLLTAPTVVATNSVAPHSRANAGHRGSVVGQL